MTEENILPKLLLTNLKNIMKKKLNMNESVNIFTLSEIAQRRFPEYKSYTQTFINREFLCINKNALFRAVVKVSHNPKKNTSTLVVNSNVTVLGSLLAGPIWGPILFSNFFKEVENTYLEELNRLGMNPLK